MPGMPGLDVGFLEERVSLRLSSVLHGLAAHNLPCLQCVVIDDIKIRFLQVMFGETGGVVETPVCLI